MREPCPRHRLQRTAHRLTGKAKISRMVPKKLNLVHTRDQGVAWLGRGGVSRRFERSWVGDEGKTTGDAVGMVWQGMGASLSVGRL